MPSSNPLPREESMPGALCAPATMTVGSYPSPSPRGTTTGAQSGKPRHWRAAFRESARDEFRLGDHAVAKSCRRAAFRLQPSVTTRTRVAGRGPAARSEGLLAHVSRSAGGAHLTCEQIGPRGELSCPNRTLARVAISNGGFPVHATKSWSGLVQSSRRLYCSA